AMALARDAANGQVTGTTLGVVADERTYNEHGSRRATCCRCWSWLIRGRCGRITAKRETIQGTTANYAYFYDVAGRLVRVEKNGVGWSNTPTTRTGTGRADGGWTTGRDIRRGRQGGVYGGRCTGTRRGRMADGDGKAGRPRRTIMTRWGTLG
ncbi:MAG: hypothetical protein IPP70_00265, partial [Elusimicrobia bacterium]|nr:hypothetical protein [Elusimicrobiota bacterium]